MISEAKAEAARIRLRAEGKWPDKQQ